VEPSIDSISLADFVAWEETQAKKHELRNGSVVSFSGGSFDHNDISLNICNALLAPEAAVPCVQEQHDRRDGRE
jgi:hypothetical protein